MITSNSFVELNDNNIILVETSNIVKLNIFNYITHPSKYAHTKALVDRCNYIKNTMLINNYKIRVKSTLSLNVLLHIHKEIWQNGFHTGALSNSYWFRKPIPELTADDVYLGNIYGLWTNNITKWSTIYRDETYGVSTFGINPDTKIYDIIVSQYKNILIKALEQIKKAIDNTLKIID